MVKSMDNSSDKNLYFSTSGPLTLHAPQPVICPLGQIIFAGTKWDSRATYAHATPPDYLRPTPHYLLVYTLEGEADYFDDTGVRSILRKGTLVWTRPGVNQSYGPRPGSRWSEFYMWFGGPVFDTWQAQGFPGNRSRLLHLEPLDYWITQFRDIVQLSAEVPAESPLMRLCRLQQILAEALQVQDASRHTVENRLWRETACRQLATGHLTSPSLNEIAKGLNLSYTLFRKRFLLLTGKTPGQYRAGEIIRRACNRLLETDHPMSRIAEEFGFHDQFHFSHHFKQRVGLSPMEFRRQVPKR
jgi:AraC-like DNA-binding protein